MSYSVRLITRQDLPRVIEINESAFIDDELFVWLFPGRYEHRDHWRRYVATRNSIRIVQPACWGVVCVDDATGIVQGIAWWERNVPKSKALSRDQWSQNNTSLTARLEYALQRYQARYDDFFKLNLATDYDNLKTFREICHEDKCLEPLEAIPHWFLAGLAVSPDAQRKGIGARLMQWAIDRAREESQETGIPTPLAVTASPVGEGLYKKVGFKVIARDAFALLEGEKFKGGAILVWDESRTYITEDIPGGANYHGWPIEVAWTTKLFETSQSDA